jgi:hypothetical protein
MRLSLSSMSCSLTAIPGFQHLIGSESSLAVVTSNRREDTRLSQFRRHQIGRAVPKRRA